MLCSVTRPIGNVSMSVVLLWLEVAIHKYDGSQEKAVLVNILLDWYLMFKVASGCFCISVRWVW